MDVKCLGWIKTFYGDKMFLFKAIIDNQLYKIVDAGMIKLLISIWDGEKFSNGGNWLEEIIEKEISKVERVDIELIKSDSKDEMFIGERLHFPIVEKEVIPIINNSKTLEGIFSKNEINRLLNLLTRDYDCLSYDKTIIDDEIINLGKEDYDLDLSFLKDFTFEHSVGGFHHTDGQLVDYTFIFTSPNGIKTTFSTLMCLMVGWNVCEKIKFDR